MLVHGDAAASRQASERLQNAALLRGYQIEERNPLTEEHMLWTVFVILLILWLLGFSFHIAGGLIHLLLVIAVVVLVINLISGRRTA